MLEVMEWPLYFKFREQPGGTFPVPNCALPNRGLCPRADGVVAVYTRAQAQSAA